MSNFVSALNETCLKKKWQVTYCTKSTGPSHAPTLHVTGVLEGDGLAGPITSTCSSSTAKAAKQMVASQLLQNSAPSADQPHIPLHANASVATTNYKGKLLEYCMQARAKLNTVEGYQPDMFMPAFTVTSTGKSNSPVFEAKVEIKLPGPVHVVTRGTGRTKKDAEQNAASLALQDLHVQKVVSALTPSGTTSSIVSAPAQRAQPSQQSQQSEEQSQQPQQQPQQQQRPQQQGQKPAPASLVVPVTPEPSSPSCTANPSSSSQRVDEEVMSAVLEGSGGSHPIDDSDCDGSIDTVHHEAQVNGAQRGRTGDGHAMVSPGNGQSCDKLAPDSSLPAEADVNAPFSWKSSGGLLMDCAGTK